jgi:hypothetical protein
MVSPELPHVISREGALDDAPCPLDILNTCGSSPHQGPLCPHNSLGNSRDTLLNSLVRVQISIVSLEFGRL